ncbi:MAG: HutD family protein [Clostridia bacterium]|nr:HutD family protein [Clostridia bacterium]
MFADVRVVRRDEHRISTWSGGETTELAIFPLHSHYAARDFAWRVSSATVAVMTSEFTRLPGYERRLLLLAGELRLRPAAGLEVVLHPGEQHVFQGETPMISYGLATDFNLMLATGWAGRLTHIVLAPGERLTWRPEDTAQHALAYCWHGHAMFSLPNASTCSLGAGDLLWAASDTARLAPYDVVDNGQDQLTLVLVSIASDGS